MVAPNLRVGRGLMNCCSKHCGLLFCSGAICWECVARSHKTGPAISGIPPHLHRPRPGKSRTFPPQGPGASAGTRTGQHGNVSWIAVVCRSTSTNWLWGQRSGEPFSPLTSPHGMLRPCSTPFSVHLFPPTGTFSPMETIAPLGGSLCPAGRGNPAIFRPKSLIFHASF